MFLSSLLSRYEDDGSLIVDLRENGGPLVRYGSYDEGVPWFRWSHEQ